MVTSGGHVSFEKGQTIVDLSRVTDSQGRSRRNQHFNSRSCKLQEALELGSSRWSLEEVLTRREVYPYHHLGYREFGKEESRVFTDELASCELRKAPAPRPSCGRVRVKLAPSACSHRWGFRRTCGSDSLKVSTRNERR